MRAIVPLLLLAACSTTGPKPHLAPADIDRCGFAVDRARAGAQEERTRGDESASERRLEIAHRH